MEIDAETKLYGLLGHPVGHSLSPLMQNMFLERTGENGVYLAWDVTPERLGEAVKGMYDLGVRGCNVTIPHKEAVIPHLVGMSKAAEACGAVNTLVRTATGFYGDNTDGDGLLAALEAIHGWAPKGKNILLIGAGGAAKGVALAMAMSEASSITIANRTIEKAEALAERIRQFSNCRVAIAPQEDLLRPQLFATADTIVQTTSLGMHPKEDDMAELCVKAIGPQHLCVDLIYNPLETKFLRLAKSQGAKTMSGIGMLLYQGVLSFERWTGKRPETAGIAEKMIAELQARG